MIPVKLFVKKFVKLLLQISGCRSPDWLALFSFAVHVLAKYPYDSDTVVSQGWRFIDVHAPTFASYVVGKHDVLWI